MIDSAMPCMAAPEDGCYGCVFFSEFSGCLLLSDAVPTEVVDEDGL